MSNLYDMLKGALEQLATVETQAQEEYEKKRKEGSLRTQTYTEHYEPSELEVKCFGAKPRTTTHYRVLDKRPEPLVPEFSHSNGKIWVGPLAFIFEGDTLVRVDVDYDC